MFDHGKQVTLRIRQREVQANTTGTGKCRARAAGKTQQDLRRVQSYRAAICGSHTEVGSCVYRIDRSSWSVREGNRVISTHSVVAERGSERGIGNEVDESETTS